MYKEKYIKMSASSNSELVQNSVVSGVLKSKMTDAELKDEIERRRELNEKLGVHPSWQKESIINISFYLKEVKKNGWNMTMEDMMKQSKTRIEIDYLTQVNENKENDSGNGSEEEHSEGEEIKDIDVLDISKLEKLNTYQEGNIITYKYGTEDVIECYGTYFTKISDLEWRKEIIQPTLSQVIKNNKDHSKYAIEYGYEINQLCVKHFGKIFFNNEKFNYTTLDYALFGETLYTLFGDTNKYDEEQGRWVGYDNKTGKWILGSKTDNFVLSRLMVNNLRSFYEELHEMTCEHLDKLVDKCKNAAPRFDVNIGTVSGKGANKRYNNFWVKIGNERFTGETTIPEKIEEYFPVLKMMCIIRVVSDHYVDELGDTDKFVPNMIKASRMYFTDRKVIKNLDKNENIMNFDNCTLIVENKEWVLVPHHPEHYCSRSTNYKLIMEVDVKKEKDVMMETMNNSFTDPVKTECMIKTKSYSLVGKNPRKRFFIDYGESGNNGKGVVDKAMEKSYGDYYSALDPNTLRKNKFTADTERPTPMLFDAIQSRYCALSEPASDTKLDGAKVKKYRGGDTQSLRKCHGNAVSVMPMWSMYMSTNFYPDLDGFDKALKDSISMIKWDVEFFKESELEKETTSKKYATDIKQKLEKDNGRFSSAWMWILLEHYDPDFEIHPDFNAEQKEEMEECNYVQQFVDECLIDVSKEETNTEIFSFLGKTELYLEAKRFYDNNNWELPIQKILIKEVSKILPSQRFEQFSYSKKVKISDTETKSMRAYFKHYKLKSKPTDGLH
jgi:phage/plasmid-associated DNA primase